MTQNNLLSLPNHVFHEHVLSRVPSVGCVSLLLRVSKTVRALVASCGALVLDCWWVDGCCVDGWSGAELGEAVAEWLKAVPGLQNLKLFLQGIGDEGAKALAAGLVSVPKLHTLDLRRNHLYGDNIETEQMRAWQEAAKLRPGLEVLHLFTYELSPSGLTSLVSLVQT